MKIGIDCRIYSSKFTGIGRYVYELIKRLAELDKANEYVLFFNNPEYKKFDPPNDRFKKVLVDTPMYSFKEQWGFRKIINREKLDLMHFTHFNSPILYRRPSIVTIHDLTLSYYPGKKKRSIIHRVGYSLVLKSAVKKAKQVITVSENSKHDLIKLLKTPLEKINVIYQGVGKEFKEIDDGVAVKSSERLGITKPFLLYTGVHRSHKNLPRLVKAFKELIGNDSCKDLRLVITGKEDPFYPEVKEEVVNLKLIDKVIFPGLVSEDDLIALYNAAEMYVFPSLYEGFGLPPLEAMACGTPVAASEVSCIPEICGKGNAVFFDPESYEDMALKMLALYNDKDLQGKLIKRGRQRVKEFSWNTMARDTFNCYKKCLNN